ncbi:unnamed protein product [Euphydryas editha]|nr:unnamed protein product [Euphydryas editha]
MEDILNKFTRFLYLKIYRMYPEYPLLYPTLFVIDMVGYSTLETRREVALAKYLIKVLRGELSSPAFLEELKLYTPHYSVERRWRPPLLALPPARTNLLRDATLTRTLRVLNAVAYHVDLFSCILDEFTRICYKL